MTIRVMIVGKLKREEDRAAFETAFEEVSRTLLKNTTGIVATNW